jgi:hypothetical protein
LKFKYDEPLSCFAFNFNLCRYTEDQRAALRGVRSRWKSVVKKVKHFRNQAEHVVLNAGKRSRARHKPIIVVAMFKADGTFVRDPSSAAWTAHPDFEAFCRKASGIEKGKGKLKKSATIL